MKKFILFGMFFFLSVNLLLAQDQKKIAPTQEGAQLTLSESFFDFGEIEQGDKVEHIFQLENTGTAPLIISNILTTCGCTATNWTSEPILPKRTGEVKIAFDSRGRSGIQNKIITIISNAVTPQHKIKITANVLPKN
ncbi:MAG: DUF1573 domain-containing protein [Bacteroidota bacterium]